jgi:hypothetical protein
MGGVARRPRETYVFRPLGPRRHSGEVRVPQCSHTRSVRVDGRYSLCECECHRESSARAGRARVNAQRDTYPFLRSMIEQRQKVVRRAKSGRVVHRCLGEGLDGDRAT